MGKPGPDTPANGCSNGSTPDGPSRTSRPRPDLLANAGQVVRPAARARGRRVARPVLPAPGTPRRRAAAHRAGRAAGHTRGRRGGAVGGLGGAELGEGDVEDLLRGDHAGGHVGSCGGCSSAASAGRRPLSVASMRSSSSPGGSGDEGGAGSVTGSSGRVAGSRVRDLADVGDLHDDAGRPGEQQSAARGGATYDPIDERVPAWTT